MSLNKDSQCYFVQLQIDGFLDDALSTGQRDVFMSHVHDCAACAAELHFAQSVQDSVMDLPLLDCDENTLEPIWRLLDRERSDRDAAHPGFWSGVREWFATAPAGLRYALPVMLAVAVLLALLPSLPDEETTPPQIAQEASPQPEYTQAEVARALQELNLAIDYLNAVGQRTEVMIGDRFLVTPLRETLDASFEQILNDEDDEIRDNGPI